MNKTIEPLAYNNPYSFKFFDGELITAFNNNPNLANVKNDYCVWGERTSPSGGKVPIHFRYAIDEKPTIYNSIAVEEDNTEIKAYNKKYNTSILSQVSVEYTSDVYDWRELIYQMAKDYYQYAHILSDFRARVADANPQFNSGLTGYEMYYEDL